MDNTTSLSRHERLQSTYRTLSDFLHENDKPALRNTSGHGDISHRAICEFVRGFRISVPNKGCLKKPIVAVILPNGPLLAATVIATSAWYAAAPISPAAGHEQVAADIRLSGASAIITCPAESDRLNLVDIGLDLFNVMQDPEGRVCVDRSHAVNMLASTHSDFPQCPNHDEDTGIILFTSGTSGTKKIVPMTTKSIVCGVGYVISSWALTDKDVCLNMMPLYHV